MKEETNLGGWIFGKHQRPNELTNKKKEMLKSELKEIKLKPEDTINKEEELRKKRIRKKVVCVWGMFESDDFVIEPYIKGDEEVGDVFWIEKFEEA